MGNLFRLGSRNEPWTQSQIDAFMDNMEEEMFDATGGTITSITRVDSHGNETVYVKNDGVWSKKSE